MVCAAERGGGGFSYITKLMDKISDQAGARQSGGLGLVHHLISHGGMSPPRVQYHTHGNGAAGQT